MNKKMLGETLRQKAETLKEIGDNEDKVTEAQRGEIMDAAECLNVLARVVERDERPESWHYGGLLAKAFGAPGDWGYSNPIGKALAAKPDPEPAAQSVTAVNHFTDVRINEVYSGSPLTKEEREFLVTDTPRFEECTVKAEELAKLSDKDLLRYAYGVWAAYAS